MSSLQLTSNWHVQRAFIVAKLGRHSVAITPQLDGQTEAEILFDIANELKLDAMLLELPTDDLQIAKLLLDDHELLVAFDETEIWVNAVPPASYERQTRHSWDAESVMAQVAKYRKKTKGHRKPTKLDTGAEWLRKAVTLPRGYIWMGLEDYQVKQLLSVAGTIAKMAEHREIQSADLAEAIQYNVHVGIQTSLQEPDLTELVITAMALGPKHTISLERHYRKG